MASITEFTTQSSEETIALGYRFGQTLSPNSIVCFFGDLAAGKTTFIKGLSTAFNSDSKEQVSSPTFVYLHIYEGTTTIYHFDLYRLRNADEFLSMGFDEHLFAGGICCVEWSERIQELLPDNCIKVHFDHIKENVRHIKIIYPKSL